MAEGLGKLQQRIGYPFRQLGLLEEALTHRSYGRPDNERLEFLGDSVIELVVSQLLFETFPKLREGELSKMRSSLVKEESLAEIARGIELGRHLKLGKGEEATWGREKASILAGALEAVVAAVYIDGGFEEAFRVVEGLFRGRIRQMEEAWRDRDYKTQLQEYTQARFKEVPRYTVVAERGPEHSKTFEVVVSVGGRIWGRGSGRSKKEAEQRAAEEALRRLDEEA